MFDPQDKPVPLLHNIYVKSSFFGIYWSASGNIAIVLRTDIVCGCMFVFCRYPTSQYGQIKSLSLAWNY